MLVDAYASLPHYKAHIEPVWRALPLHHRGDFRGLGSPTAPPRWPQDRLVIVASHTDALRAGPRPFVYVEHGAGQSYSGDPASARITGHNGGPGLDRCVLFLCPNEGVAGRWRAAYHSVPAVVVGCPRLDAHHARVWGRDGGPERERGRVPSAHLEAQPTVAFTFHWDCGLLPETRSAWNHYGPRLHRLDLSPWRLVGHGHPREWPVLQRRWRRVGAQVTHDIDAVLEGADVLVADNTSAMWEFASLDKPLVILDAPWYRRAVEHGLRFWTHADAGVRIDDPADLPAAIAQALRDHPTIAANRRAAVADVYSALDGRAAERAAAAITALVEG